MFEDHWYEHSISSQPEFANVSVQRSGSVKRQQDQTRAPEKAALRNAVKHAPAETPKRKHHDPPKPSRRPRASSYASPEDLQKERFSAFEENEEESQPSCNHLKCSPPRAEVPVRSKSRNALYDNRRYGENFGRSREQKKPKQLQDELDLMEWYQQYEDELQDASNYEHKLFCSTLKSHLWTCQGLLSTTDSTLDLLSLLGTSFIAVRNQTTSFESQCEDLIAEEKRLGSLVNNIGKGLEPFGELDGILRKLNKPGTEFVKTRGFADMLKTLDWCLEDLGKYQNFKDTATYLPRFRQCMTRALTLIRNYLVSAFREIQADVSKRVAAKGMNETAQSALLYAKFRLNAPELRDLAGEIEKRSAHEEYVALLQECYSAFFQIRRALVLPAITKKVSELSTANADLVTFARSGLSYLKSICLDESELFYAYFSTGEQDLYSFLESLCASLFDQLRPKIAREMHLIRLCELCTLLQTRYMRDPEEAEVEPHDKSQIDFGLLIQTVLQDTQTRLVARAQAIVKEEIELFSPSPNDLDYPSKAKLLIKNSKLFRNETPSNGIEVESPDTDPVLPEWFPTLRKTIWLLSRIYRLVNQTVFGDLAHQVVHSCTLSLVKASQLLHNQKSPVDGQLFLIKHLLILKEQIMAFDIEYLPQNPDAQQEETLSGTFWDVYAKGELLTRDGIFRLVSTAMPKAVNNMIDAKIELDGILRRVITQFAADYASQILPQAVSSVWEQQNPTALHNSQSTNKSLQSPSSPHTDVLSPSQQSLPRSTSPLPPLPSLSSLPSIPFLSSAARSLTRSVSPAPPQRIGTLSVRSTTSSPPIHRITSSHIHSQKASSLSITTFSSPHQHSLPPPLPLPAAPVIDILSVHSSEIMAQIESLLPLTLGTIRTKLTEYISDTRTREALIGAVLEAVLNRYEQFYSVLEGMGRTVVDVGERAKIGEKISGLWHPDRLGMWVESVANEGRLGQGQEQGWMQAGRMGENGEEEKGIIEEIRSQAGLSSEDENEEET